MKDLFNGVDELGPAQVSLFAEQHTGLRAAVVIDNVAAGPALGGVRMADDVTLDECHALARAMTLKNAMAGLPHGGAKSVIAADPRRHDKEDVIRAFAHRIRDLTDYIPGPDMGTDEQAMAWVHDEIGRAAGLPAHLGGIPLDELGATAFGVTVALEAAAPAVGITLDGARIALQGYGAVARPLARMLRDRGSIVVAVTDSQGGVEDSDGLDLELLDSAKDAGRSVGDADAGKPLALDDLVAVECDICIPAARPAAIRADNVARVQARLVVEAANVPTTREADSHLDDAGIVVLPDFVVNAGGVICGAVEFAKGTSAAAFQTIEDRIRSNIDELFHGVDSPTRLRARAHGIAKGRVERAMAVRRWI